MSALLVILMIGALGLPAVAVSAQIVLTMLRVCRREFRNSAHKVCFGGALVCAAVGLAIQYFLVFVAELWIQGTCEGAGCAQGGVGLVGVTPLPWLSCLLLLGLERLLFNGRFLPRLPPKIWGQNGP